MSVKGYVIQNGDGKFLTQKYFWYEHDRPEEAWVHPERTLDVIRETSEMWDIKPTKKILAEYSEETGTVILGEVEQF